MVNKQGEAIMALANDINEMRQGGKIAPLQPGPGGTLEKIVNIIAGAVDKMPRIIGGGDSELSKRAVDMLFRMGEANLQNTLIINRKLQESVGLRAMAAVSG